MPVQVYKARFHGSPVAVKALVGEEGTEASALQEEATILESLRHPHIVHYLDCIVDKEDGTVCAHWTIVTMVLVTTVSYRKRACLLRVMALTIYVQAKDCLCSCCMHPRHLLLHLLPPLRRCVFAGILGHRIHGERRPEQKNSQGQSCAEANQLVSARALHSTGHCSWPGISP